MSILEAGILDLEKFIEKERFLNVSRRKLKKLDDEHLLYRFTFSDTCDYESASTLKLFENVSDALCRGKQVLAAVQQTSQIGSQLDGANLLKLPKAIPVAPNITLCIASIDIYPRFAALEVYVKIDMEGKQLIFGAPNIRFAQSAGFIGGFELALLGDFGIPVLNDKLELVFKSADYTLPSQSSSSDMDVIQLLGGTWASFDCDGKVDSISVEAKIAVDTSVLIPVDNQGSPMFTKRIEADIQFSFNNNSQFIVGANFDLQKCMIPNKSDLVFTLGEFVYDNNDNENHENFVVPEYLKDETAPDMEHPDWRGLYFEMIRLDVPSIFNGDCTEGENCEEELAIEFRNFYIDDMGVSGAVNAQNVVPWGERTINKWGFSLNHFALSITRNQFDSLYVEGSIHVPLFRDSTEKDFNTPLTENDAVGYSGFYTSSGTWSIGARNVFKRSLPMFIAEVSLAENTEISMTKSNDDLIVRAHLYGSLSFTKDIPGLKLSMLPQDVVRFDSVVLSTASSGPLENLGYWQMDVSIIEDIAQSANIPFRISNMQVLKNQDEEPQLKLTTELDIQESMNLSACASFMINGKFEEKDNAYNVFNYSGIEVSAICLDAGGAVPGVEILQGCIFIEEAHEKYGDYKQGMLKVKFSGMNQVLKAIGQFGTTSYGADDGEEYSYFYVDVLVEKLGVDLAPGIILDGIGGGLAVNMSFPSATEAFNQMQNEVSNLDTVLANGCGSQESGNQQSEGNEFSPGLTLSGWNYTPEEGIIGFKATVILKSGVPIEGELPANEINEGDNETDEDAGKSFTMLVTLGMQFLKENGNVSLDKIFLTGIGEFLVPEPDVLKELQPVASNGGGTSMLDMLEEEGEVASAGGALKFFVVMEVDFSEMSFEGLLSVDLNFMSQVQNSSSNGVSFESELNIWAGIYADPDYFYLHVGNPCSRNNVSFSFRVAAGEVEMSSGFTATQYMMMGNKHIPGLPPPFYNPQACEFALADGTVGDDWYKVQCYSQLGDCSFDKFLSDFAPEDYDDNLLGTGKGFAFGLSFYFYLKARVVIFEADLHLNMGVDATFREVCDGIGINGWYLQGQAWASVSASLSININLLFLSKRFVVLEGEAAALVSLNTPNPTFGSAHLRAQIKLFGGIIKFKGQLKFDFGEKPLCANGNVPGTYDPDINVVDTIMTLSGNETLSPMEPLEIVLDVPHQTDFRNNAAEYIGNSNNVVACGNVNDLNHRLRLDEIKVSVNAPVICDKTIYDTYQQGEEYQEDEFFEDVHVSDEAMVWFPIENLAWQQDGYSALLYPPSSGWFEYIKNNVDNFSSQYNETGEVYSNCRIDIENLGPINELKVAAVGGVNFWVRKEEENTDNSPECEWLPLRNANGTTYQTTKSIIVELTDIEISDIPDHNVLYSYPISSQNHFHKDQHDTMYVKLNQDQGDLLDKEGCDLLGSLFELGEHIEGEGAYQEQGETIQSIDGSQNSGAGGSISALYEFDMIYNLNERLIYGKYDPSVLQNNFRYQLKIQRVCSNAADNLDLKKISFTTSLYSTFGQKIEDSNVSHYYEDAADFTAKGDYLSATIELNEDISDMEFGGNHNIAPLISSRIIDFGSLDFQQDPEGFFTYTDNSPDNLFDDYYGRYCFMPLGNEFKNASAINEYYLPIIDLIKEGDSEWISRMFNYSRDNSNKSLVLRTDLPDILYHNYSEYSSYLEYIEMKVLTASFFEYMLYKHYENSPDSLVNCPPGPQYNTVIYDWTEEIPLSWIEACIDNLVLYLQALGAQESDLRNLLAFHLDGDTPSDRPDPHWTGACNLSHILDTMQSSAELLTLTYRLDMPCEEEIYDIDYAYSLWEDPQYMQGYFETFSSDAEDLTNTFGAGPYDYEEEWYSHHAIPNFFGFDLTKLPSRPIEFQDGEYVFSLFYTLPGKEKPIEEIHVSISLEGQNPSDNSPAEQGPDDQLQTED